MRTPKVVAVLTLGALIGTGCAEKDSAGGSPDSKGNGVKASAPSAAKVSFEDGFDDDRNEWGAGDSPEHGTTAYQGGDYVWKFKGRVAHLVPGVLGAKYDKGTLDMLNVVVRSEATIERGGGVIGVHCRESRDTNAEFQWYEFVARDGFAAIRLADDESNIKVLAKTDDVALPIGQPIKFEAGCINDTNGDAQLSLTLNGVNVLQATHGDALGNGVPGIQAWTHPIHQQMDVRWHKFSIHQPSP